MTSESWKLHLSRELVIKVSGSADIYLISENKVRDFVKKAVDLEENLADFSLSDKFVFEILCVAL